MIQQPTNYMPAPAPNKYSAIEINILGASVNPKENAAAPAPAAIPAPVQPQNPEVQKLNYMA